MTRKLVSIAAMVAALIAPCAALAAYTGPTISIAPALVDIAPQAIVITTPLTWQLILATSNSRGGCGYYNNNPTDIEYIYIGTGTPTMATAVEVDYKETAYCATPTGQILKSNVWVTSATLPGATGVLSSW